MPSPPHVASMRIKINGIFTIVYDENENADHMYIMIGLAQLSLLAVLKNAFFNLLNWKTPINILPSMSRRLY